MRWSAKLPFTWVILFIDVQNCSMPEVVPFCPKFLKKLCGPRVSMLHTHSRHCRQCIRRSPPHDAPEKNKITMNRTSRGIRYFHRHLMIQFYTSNYLLFPIYTVNSIQKMPVLRPWNYAIKNKIYFQTSKSYQSFAIQLCHIICSAKLFIIYTPENIVE